MDNCDQRIEDFQNKNRRKIKSVKVRWSYFGYLKYRSNLGKKLFTCVSRQTHPNPNRHTLTLTDTATILFRAYGSITACIRCYFYRKFWFLPVSFSVFGLDDAPSKGKWSLPNAQTVMGLSPMRRL